MSKKTNDNVYGAILDNPIATLIVAILTIPLGLFFIFMQNDNTPVTREEAIAYAGYFDHYDTSLEDYREICFEDGSAYEVYAHTESGEFQEKMKSLEKGTKLYILVNPNNHCVAEIKTDTEELMNFELSQQEIADYDDGYVGIGVFVLAAGLLLVIYTIARHRSKQNQEARHIARKAQGNSGGMLRYADEAVKSRTLLEATVGLYQISYRRVKSVNELVVNGWVYDEIKGIIEFEHTLCATVDGHTIEAGYDEDSYSYIMFDGRIIKRKRRWI